MNIVSCIEMTSLCNWSCEYCIAGTQKGKYKDFTDEQFGDILEFILKTENPIVISGGEPGLLGEKKLVKLFDVLINFEYPIYINTNGTFIDIFFSRVLSILKDKYTGYQVNKLLHLITIRFHLFQNLTQDFDMNNMNNIITNNKFPSLQNLPENIKRIINRLKVIKSNNVKIENQIVFTKKDDILTIEFFIMFYTVICNNIFRNYPLVVSPVYFSNKNKDSKDLGFNKIEILRLLKRILIYMGKFGMDKEQTIEAFKEALGEIKVKYKLPETTTLWKRKTNE